MKILVISEQRQGKLNATSLETIVAAQQIAAINAGTVSVVVIGKGVASLADELATKNVAEVLLVEHDLLDALHSGRILRRVEARDRSGQSQTSCCSHTPIRCGTLRPYWRQDSEREWWETASVSAAIPANWFLFDRCFRARPQRTLHSRAPHHGSYHSSRERFERIYWEHTPAEKRL